MRLGSFGRLAGLDGGWMKSPLSADGLCCVVVRAWGETVLIADSKYRRDPANSRFLEPVIQLPAATYDAWLDALAAGDGRQVEGAPTVTTLPDGGVELCSATDGTTLRYTPDEWAAWLGGLDALRSEVLRAA